MNHTLKNRFVVLEGLDGAGKSTQIKLFCKHLEQNNIKYKFLHFPRTDAPYFGELVSGFLRGDFGELNQVNPYLVALIYAGDRHQSKEMIESWLNEGYFVLVDRYVNSNIAFQCAKTENKIKSEELRKWILSLEYDYYKIPKPDINLFLDVPFEFTAKNLKTQREGDDRIYLKGKNDIHEKDLDFQNKVRQVYINIQKTDKSFHIINCSADDNTMLSSDKIFKKIKLKIRL
ncbi:MAG: dTMP kinase [Bacteroidota bacterium]